MIGASNIYFKEEQKLREVWLWLILGMAALLSIGGLILALYNPEDSQTDIYIGLIIAVPVQTVIIVMLYLSNFEVKVNEEGVHYKWYPFHMKFRTINRSSIENFYVRDVPVFKRGISYVWGFGWSYNTTGGKGIQFELRNNKRIFLGSQKVNALRNAIEQLMQLKK